MIKVTKIVLDLDSAIVSTERTRRTVSEPDLLAIKLVAIDGHRMALEGKERLEALKLMCRHDLPQELIAWRLCMGLEALRRYAQRSKIKLPLVRRPAHWSVDYMDKRNDLKKRRLEKENAQRQVGKQRSDELEGTTQD